MRTLLAWQADVKQQGTEKNCSIKVVIQLDSILCWRTFNNMLDNM